MLTDEHGNIGMMANKSAVQLGKRGGHATATKRTKAQRSEAARNAANKRWEERRREREPNLFVFEMVLMDYWFSEPRDKRARKHYFSDHRIPPLVDAGYVEFDRKIEHKYKETPHENWTEKYYRPTAAGIRWWIEQRAAELEKAAIEHPAYAGCDVKLIAPKIDGKGIGCEIQFSIFHTDDRHVYVAMRDGLLEFVTAHDGRPAWLEYVTARLTQKGYDYFNSLPRFVEVWE